MNVGLAASSSVVLAATLVALSKRSRRSLSPNILGLHRFQQALQVVLVLADEGFNLLVALGAMRAINLANHLLALGDFGQGEQLARLLPGPFQILM